jgi:SAM-dependent methyltransferase
MPTHQSLSGSTDERLVERMVATHAERHGADYWKVFAEHVAPRLPARPTVVDVGCGPGLWLRDVGERCGGAALHGYDVTPAMLAHGRQLVWTGARPTLALLDVTTEPLPHAAGTVDLVGMSSVLHVLDEPLPVLTEIRRVLAPGGTFLLNDWIRQPLETYLAWRRDTMGESEAECLTRGFRLFPAHNKYTPGDWQWLLARAGFALRGQAQLRPSHVIFVAAPDGAGGARSGT